MLLKHVESQWLPIGYLKPDQGESWDGGVHIQDTSSWWRTCQVMAGDRADVMNTFLSKINIRILVDVYSVKADNPSNNLKRILEVEVLYY